MSPDGIQTVLNGSGCTAASDCKHSKSSKLQGLFFQRKVCTKKSSANFIWHKFDVTPSANFMTPSANPISGVWYESAHVGPILLLTGTSFNSEKSVRQSQWPAPPMVLRLFRGSSARMCVSIFATNILSKKQSFDVTPSANFMTPSANPISGVWYESAHVSPILWWTGTSCNSEKRKKKCQTVSVAGPTNGVAPFS